jgi:hypothetical protein
MRVARTRTGGTLGGIREAVAIGMRWLGGPKASQSMEQKHDH